MHVVDLILCYWAVCDALKKKKKKKKERKKKTPCFLTNLVTLVCMRQASDIDQHFVRSFYA